MAESGKLGDVNPVVTPKRIHHEATRRSKDREGQTSLGIGPSPPRTSNGRGGRHGWASGGRQAPAAGEAALARYLPQQDLAVYLEFEGLDAHAAAWHKSAAYKLLNDTSLGALLEDIAGQVVEMAQASGPPAEASPSASYLDLLKHGARNGFAFGVVGKGPENTRVVIVVRKGNRPETPQAPGIGGRRRPRPARGEARADPEGRADDPSPGT